MEMYPSICSQIHKYQAIRTCVCCLLCRGKGQNRDRPTLSRIYVSQRREKLLHVERCFLDARSIFSLTSKLTRALPLSAFLKLRRKASTVQGIFGKSQPAKNRNLKNPPSGAILRTRCLQLSATMKLPSPSTATPLGVLNCAEAPASTCLLRNLPCLVFESSNTFLTYT